MAYAVELRSLSVHRFFGSDSSYIAYCEENLRLDIAKCRNYLPAGIDPADYHHYMWVSSLQGFFVLRQRVRGRLSEEWTVIAELVPGEYHSSFFEEIWEDFESLSRSFQAPRV